MGSDTEVCATVEVCGEGVVAHRFVDPSGAFESVTDFRKLFEEALARGEVL